MIAISFDPNALSALGNIFISRKNTTNGVEIILRLQVILFEIDFAIFYTNLHELFCQFIS